MKFLTKGQNPKWKFEYAYAAVFIQDWKAQEAKYRVYRKRFWGWERVNPVLVTGDDFDAYSAAFTAGDITADFNKDGFVTGDDFDAFVLAFESGC